MTTVTRTDLPDFDLYVSRIRQLWDSRWISNDGPFLRGLEEGIGTHLGINGKVVAVTNGTVALQIALMSMGIRGDVITTPFTFSATINALIWAGITPVFADIKPDTYCIDPASVVQKITEKTTAILAVHVYGNPCDVYTLEKIAKDYGLKLVFDAAHAFGVEYDGISVLNFGHASTMSFHPTKVFHTVEGGAIVSSDEDVIRKSRLLRNHGIVSEDVVEMAGTNAKMDEFRAIMGICNLETVNSAIERRGVLYSAYMSRLGGSVVFQNLTASRHNHIYMPVLFETEAIRNLVYRILLENGVHARKYFYPVVTDFNYITSTDDTPVARDVAKRVLCLPLYPELDEKDVGRIADIVVGATCA